MPTHDGQTEPDITINGHPLTFAECLTLRVALSTFLITLSEPRLRAGMGEVVAANYAYHGIRIAQAMRIEARDERGS